MVLHRSSPSFCAVLITLGEYANKQPLSLHLYFSMIISVHGHIPTALSFTSDTLIHKTRDLNLLTRHMGRLYFVLHMHLFLSP